MVAVAVVLVVGVVVGYGVDLDIPFRTELSVSYSQWFPIFV